MSQLTHARPRILPVRPLFRLKAGVAAVLIAATITFALVISAPDNATPAPNVAAPAAEAGVRYDGGPDEGTRGIAHATQSVTGTENGTRYDGGPEEGSVGLGR